ncbi:sigma-70 family RNA polymerase sigma factor [Bacillus velezensis]|uniref:sigma-70 family RNA polymerase sigma factor n=1 Tax=Bacillus amyloliquefaciens group TaxID=1938374 RepID=UPI002DB9D734|nr:sigma-70 family RNA polymerase sigma factor [Bacillus velezensis]MEC0385618.1 sigma-70 family RNA polymerase sigma factor [Bacillus velezensis]MEC0388760.1 sigma-70 family RNA polymerase sigma factor [Bacillus velezensis]
MNLAEMDLQNMSVIKKGEKCKFIDGKYLTKEETITQFTPLVRRIANGFYGQGKGAGLDLDDLIQSGYEGLITAYDQYDEKRTNKFITYAYKVIFYSTYDSIKRFSGIFSFSDEVKELGYKIKKLDLEKEEPAYISNMLSISDFKAEMALAFLRHQKTISFDPFLDKEKWGGLGITDDTSLIEVGLFLSSLNDEDKKAIKLLMDGYSYRELGKITGKSGGYAYYVKKRASKKYREFAY